MHKLLLTLAFTISCIGCSSAAVESTPARYPALVRATFLSSCEVQGTPEACECVLDYLEQSMTYDEFVALEAAGSEAVQADSRIQAAVAKCLS
jgi:ABC-type phosphate/phosphonate transport system substrate-binding protein